MWETQFARREEEMVTYQLDVGVERECVPTCPDAVVVHFYYASGFV